VKTYDQYEITQQIQNLLPADFRFSDKCSPTEETFKWRNSFLHVDRLSNPDATHKIILHHGVGSNGRLLTAIIGVALVKRGYEVVAIDMPLYGMSENNEPSITYEDWLDVSCQLIESETQRDGKPIILYGLSAGGMLAYHVACMEPRVKGIVGMCFLDLADQSVTDMISPFPALIEHLSISFMNVVGSSPLKKMRVPMKLICKMTALTNDKAMLKTLLSDQHSAGAWVPFNFLASLFNYKAAKTPEEFDVCPVLLTQPAVDTWTPLAASQKFYDRLATTKSIVMLEGAGHYPLEMPGLQQLIDGIDHFIKGLPSK